MAAEGGSWVAHADRSYSEQDGVDALSLIDSMNDHNLSEELVKVRNKFGFGKGKKKRKERKAIRKHARHIKRTKRKAKRKKFFKGITSFVKDVAGAFGGKGGVAPEVQERLLANEPQPVEEKKIMGMSYPMFAGVA